MEEILKAITDFKNELMAKLNEMTRTKTSTEILAGWPGDKDLVPPFVAPPEPEPEPEPEPVPLLTFISDNLAESVSPAIRPDDTEEYVWIRKYTICKDRIFWERVKI